MARFGLAGRAEITYRESNCCFEETLSRKLWILRKTIVTSPVFATIRARFVGWIIESGPEFDYPILNDKVSIVQSFCRGCRIIKFGGYLADAKSMLTKVMDIRELDNCRISEGSGKIRLLRSEVCCRTKKVIGIVGFFQKKVPTKDLYNFNHRMR